MRILHTADYHITCLKKLLGEENAYNRADKALNNLLYIVASEKPDVITITGDIFDNSNPYPDEIFLFNKFLFPLIESGIHIIILPGNHDSWNEGGKTALDFLYPVKSFKNFHLILRESRVVSIEDTDFICWPWGVYPEKENLLLFSRNKKRIGLMHVPLLGSIISSTKATLKKGYSLDTVNETLSQFRLDYLLLGDIHEYQVFDDRIIYSGALYQTKFNESENKGVVLIDTNKHSKTFILIDEVPLLKSVNSIGKVTSCNFYKLHTDSKESAIKNLNRLLPSNIVKIEHRLQLKKEEVKESNRRIGVKVSIIPILIEILKKDNVKDVVSAMRYLSDLAESKEDFLLP